MPYTVNPDFGYLEYRDGGSGSADVEEFDVDTGSNVEPLAGVVTVTGTSVYSDGSVANTLTLNTQATANTFLLGAGTLTTMTEFGPLTNGQLIIGSTGASPSAGSITSTDGSVTITGGAGTIDLAVAAADDAILTITGTSGGALSPTAGNVNLLSSTVANATNAIPLSMEGSGSTLTAEIQVATEITGAPGDKNDAGLSSYDDTQFAVDANGYVTLVGGATLPAVQTLTSDDPTAVGPDGSGNITVTGEATANATNAKPVYVDAGANALNVEVQVGTEITGAPGDKNDAGLVSFDDTMFSVDADGYTTLVASASFTTGSVIFWGASAFEQDNSNFFWDDTNNYLGVGTNTPTESVHVVGNMLIDHTAAESDDHALEIIVDANGFTDVKGLDIDYITGAIAAGEDEEAMLVNIDESASTGGIVAGYLVLSTAEGSATINGYETGININPIVHESGTFGDADNILNKAVDVTAALASGGAGNISIFVADNDTFTIGDAATWDEMEIILGTGASGAGVAPTFEYSTGGAAYSAFSPADGTNGFKNTGAILWDSSTLAGWATATSGEYEIRITRTRNTLSTTPIIDELQIAATTEFKWDKNGDVNLNSLTLVTDLAVAHGGTGASTLTDGGVMLGSGTGAVTVLGQATNGQLVIGSTGTDPVLAALASADGSVTITNGAGTIDLSVTPASFDSVGVYNLGFDYNGGTGVFSITSADGTALSATNIGYVTIWSREASDPGTLVTIPITANVSFIDDVGASEIIGNLFGTVTGVAYGNDLPFWIHAVLNNDEDAIAFCLTRNAFGLTSPAAADIGAPDDPVADEQNDYWAFDSLDETLYDLNPSMPIGVIAMQKSAADDWTVQGLYASSSGVNFPNGFLGLGFSENFTGLAGSFAAATGSFLLDNGGTAPTFTNQEMKYKYLGPQSMRVVFNFNGNTATDGAGAVNTKIMVPYTGSTTLNALPAIVGTGYVDCPAYTGMVMFEMSGNEQFIQIRDINGNYFQNEDFSDGDRTIEGSIVYITGDNP